MGGRIGKILGRKAPDPPELADALQRLSRLAEEQPELAAAARQQTALLRAMYAAPAGAEPPTISPETAAARLGGGMPLLRGLDPPMRPERLRERFLRLCAAVSENGGPVANLAPELVAAVRAGRLDLWRMARDLLAGEGSALPARVEELGLPGDLAMTMLRLALLPALAETSRQLAPLLASRPWRHGYCPLCGAWPILAEQRGLEQFRYLRCGLCATSWQVDRIFCPACGTHDHTRLAYLHVEEEEQRQRIATCDNCGSYLKLRNALAPLSPPQLLVEELALVHLDLIALDRGYAAPA